MEGISIFLLMAYQINLRLNSSHMLTKKDTVISSSSLEKVWDLYLGSFHRWELNGIEKKSFYSLKEIKSTDFTF